MILEYGFDTVGSKILSLDTSLALPTGHRLGFGLGVTHTDAEDASFPTQAFRVGYATNPLDLVNGGINLEHWGKDLALKTTSFRGALNYAPLDWIVSFTPEYRKISLIAAGERPLLPSIDGGSFGIGGRVLYYGWPSFSLDAGFMKYHYVGESANLTAMFESGVISTDAYILSSNFVTETVSLGGTYVFPALSLGLELSLGRLFIDGSSVRTGLIKAGCALGKDVSLQGQVGVSTSVNFSNARIYAFEIAYFW